MGVYLCTVLILLYQSIIRYNIKTFKNYNTNQMLKLHYVLYRNIGGVHNNLSSIYQSFFIRQLMHTEFY
jgi:hypothetical protein